MTYTPDIWVVRNGQDFLVECKPEKFVDTADNQAKFAAAREWCVDHDHQFEIVVAEELRAGFRLRNIKLMTLNARHELPAGFCMDVRDQLSEGAITLNELASRLDKGRGQPLFSWLLCLAFHHEIEIPIDDAAITDRSYVHLGGVR